MNKPLQYYYEFNPNLDYSRKNLRWNGWGSHSEDYHAIHRMPFILEFLQRELNQETKSFYPQTALEEILLPPSRFSDQDRKFLLECLPLDKFHESRFERIVHSTGKSYFDVVRLHFNLLDRFVDGVCYPTTEGEISKLLRVCESRDITVVPYGGGSSVVGGLEPLLGKKSQKTLSVDLSQMNHLVRLDRDNHTATFQAGIYGPQLEKALNREGFTLGHFPQSFVYSTLGGWVATRSAGQQSNRYGKIEDMVASVKMITFSGVMETGTYPAGAMGPDWNQMITGSEGLLGILTEVTVHIRPLPQKRFFAGFLFPNFESGRDFIKEINQAEIETTMLRLSDEEETRLFGALSNLGNKGVSQKLKVFVQQTLLSLYGLADKKTALVFGLEGSEDYNYSRFLEIRAIAQKHRGFFAGESLGKHWIENRFNLPFLRNHLMEYGFGVDTMETSTTYDKLDLVRNEFHVCVKEFLPQSLSLCHISHSYTNGACLYFTVIFRVDSLGPIAQWKELKKRVTEVFFRHSTAISHHHGIGLDHKQWYERQSSAEQLEALRAMKNRVDPKGLLNPQKLFADC